MSRNNLTLRYSAILAVTVICTYPSVASADNEPITPISSCASANTSDIGLCADAHDQSVTAAANRRRKRQTTQSQPNINSSTVDDQRPKETAEASLAPEVKLGWHWEACILNAIGKEANSRIASDYECDSPPPSNDKQQQDPDRQPTTEEILYAAAAVIRADGAGLRKRPDGVSYTNRFVPTIVSVTNPTQTHVINLLGRDISITLTATNYEYSWGDGTPNTVTTSPGLAWEKGIDPNNDPRLIGHYYTPPQGWRSMLDGPYPHENREITLTTTWSGTLTNPFTGETQTINGLVTTTETTGEFPLSHLVINNTDTWEEKQGH